MSNMDSNTYEHDQMVVSNEITPTSSPKNTYGINKSDLTETSSQKSGLSKTEEQIKSSIKSDDNNVETKKVVAENISSGNGIVLSDNNELLHIEEEGENICDTCGDLGWANLLVICSKCSVGAEHTYCMMPMVKVLEVPQNWFCYDCTQNKDEMREREENEETNTRKRKAESFIDFFKMEDKTSLQRQHNLLNIDLNMDPENEDEQSGKRYCVDTKLSL